jgi:murein DD-endopeptidase MepM/ murein hydrolase activator NlpD
MRREAGLAAAAALLAAALGLASAEPASAPPSAAPVAPDVLRPPVMPACISSPFGPRVLPGLPKAGTFHSGIDLPAPAGGAVLAAASGVVARIRRRGPGGLEVLVRHRPGFETLYAHLGSVTAALASGRQTVAAGEKLGVVGRSGVTYGTHLYFATLIDGRPVDPERFLTLPRCR